MATYDPNNMKQTPDCGYDLTPTYAYTIGAAD